MKGYLRAAAASFLVSVADPENNKKEIVKLMKKASCDGAKLLVLPELSVTGYTAGDLFREQCLLDGAMEALEDIVEASVGLDLLVVVGHPLLLRGKLFNAAGFIYEGELLAAVPKQNIPNYNEFYEYRNFAPGFEEVVDIELLGRKVPFGGNIILECRNIPGLSIGLEICEDLWSPLPPSTFLAMNGATVIVNPSASDETIAKADYRRSLVTGQAARTISAYVYCSAGEGESTGDLIFSAHHIISENGNILSESGRFKNEMIVADIDIERIVSDRARMTSYPDAFSGEDVMRRISFEFKKPFEKYTRTFSRTPFVPQEKEKRDSRSEEILTMQAFGLKKRLEYIGSRVAVVGVSGGLDSTLALLVAVRALDLMKADRKGIIGITMPCFGTSGKTHKNAIALMEALGISSREIPIASAVEGHLKDIGHDMDVKDVTYENAQARERTQVLMDVANDTGGIVVGTGDMSELALGWCTYNGDHMSMYSVNAGVPKTLVKYLVGYYAETDKSVRKILESILATPISPELIPPDKTGRITQKTEDRIGPYELHDFFLYYMLRFGMRPSKIFEMASASFRGVYDEETVLKWMKVFYRRFFSQQFKRSCLPDGPKIGTVSLSPRGDLRMPSDASAALWLSELDSL